MKTLDLSVGPVEFSKLLGVAAAYALTSWLTRQYFSPLNDVSIFYLASGVALAAVLLGGVRYAGAVAIGSLLVNVLLGDVLWASALNTCGVTLAALTGSWLIRRRRKFDIRLRSLRDIIRVCIWGGLVGSSVSAVIGGASLWLSGVVDANGYPGLVLDWVMGDALGVVLMTPLLLLWWPAVVHPRSRPRPWQIAEALFILICTLLAGGVIFLDWGHNTLPMGLHLVADGVGQGYWMFLFIAWAAIRTGQRGTALALLLVATMGVSGILAGTGFFHISAAIGNLTGYWSYSFILSLVGLALASSIDLAKRNNQQELRQSEERLQLATRSGGIGIWDWNLQTNMLIWDDVMLRLYGLERLGFSGAIDAWQVGMHPDDLEAQLVNTQNAIAGTHAFDTEFRVVHPDGSMRVLKSNADVVRDAKGQALRMVGVSWDISATKQKDAELANHRNNLEQLVAQKTVDLEASAKAATRSLNELVHQKFVLDQHAMVTMCGVDGLITYGNQKFSEATGYSPEEFLGQDHKIVNSGYHPKGFFKEMYDTISRGAVWRAEVCNRAKDGHLYWVDSTVAAFMGDDGKPREYIAVRTDITERKQAEEAAHAANRSKSEFLANMSHEIRTPMNGVIGMVDILQQTPLLPEQARMLDTIHASSMALLNILNDILDFSKIEAGKLEMESIPTHLREVTEGVAQLMLNVAGSKDAQISLFVDPALPTWVLSDPTRLRQVLFNLLGNALKFIPKGAGRAMLHVHPVVRPDGVACVQFCVIDNGIGMSEEVVAKLFQPFTQADATTARKFGGTGLGLSITQRLVEMMHGRISVSSTPGAGSEFMVEFPLQAAPAPTGRAPSSTPDLSGLRVLAVTPLAACSTLFQVYLGAAGAQVHVVPDLATARAELAHMANMTQQPGDTVLLLDLEDDGDPADADAHLHAQPDNPSTTDTPWPAGVRVVRLVNRAAVQEPLPDNDALETRVMARPLLHHDLIHAVAVAGGRARDTDTARTIGRRRAPRFETPSVEVAAQTGCLILIAEDNETNRDVMREQLRLLGYACEMADDGALALQMWQSGRAAHAGQADRYALLLTDCHMPNMDGFALTEVIRTTQASQATLAHLPIIAITANAMQGEAQRCRARGMDDYLSKPLRLNELGPMLAKWMPKAVPVMAQPDSENPELAPADHELAQGLAKAAGDDALAVWNQGTLNDLVGDNPVMHKRLLEKFLANATEQVASIDTSTNAGRLGETADVAHTLKSAARSVGALALGELCQQLENAGNVDDAATCSALAQRLAGAFAAAALAINRHLAP